MVHKTGNRSEEAPAVIKKIHKQGTEADPLRGLFESTIDGKLRVVEYESDSESDPDLLSVVEEGDSTPQATAQQWYCPT